MAFRNRNSFVEMSEKGRDTRKQIGLVATIPS